MLSFRQDVTRFITNDSHGQIIDIESSIDQAAVVSTLFYFLLLLNADLESAKIP